MAQGLVATEWSQRYAGNGTVQNGLNTHFARLLSNRSAIR